MFKDRRDAGQLLARLLEPLATEHPVVLAVPRGGVAVAYEVARRLEAPLDVVLVRKLGVPSQPELGFGAIGEDGIRVLDPGVIARAGISETDITEVAAAERAELERRVRAYRRGRPPVDVSGRVVVIVDDGIATGVSIRAAAHIVRARGAGRVVIAAPVGPPAAVARLFEDADDVIVAEEPIHMMAIGAWYHDFHQVGDDEVTSLLDRSCDDLRNPARPGTCRAGRVSIPAGAIRLEGSLHVPDGATGIVAFAHGSGSSRHSPRNRRVATLLNEARLGTLLFDLLTDDEAADRRWVFDIDLLAGRLATVIRWLPTHPDAHGLPIGIFGASTGAAAALAAAAEERTLVRAVVSRGGRPDLVSPQRLSAVEAPTLLIVGGADHPVIEMNRQAAAHLRCEHRIEIVPGAGHLFEQAGALDVVANLAASWFSERLTDALTPARR